MEERRVAVGTETTRPTADMRVEIWNRLRTPPPTALKKITGGRLSGKSDINPQWRWQAMTEEFGPCGVGWKFREADRWTEAGDAGEIMCFVKVEVSFRDDPLHGWSQPIEGIGGSKLVEREKNGLHNNDEGWKMATTDALGTACKYLGLAADVYLGGGGGATGSKYDRDSGPAPKARKPREKKTEKSADPVLKWDKPTMEKYERSRLEGWEKEGYGAATKFARDSLGVLVYCKGCLGPTMKVISTHPKAPEFNCMGIDSNTFCEALDTKGDVSRGADGQPYRFGWWKGEWYSPDHGGWPYSGIAPEKQVATQGTS